MLRDFCSVSKSEYDDFVGLKFIDGQPKIIFPRGFRLSEDEGQTRKDILRLLAIIQRFSGHCEGSKSNSYRGETTLSFPILSYQYIIKDFLAHGYYIEQETQYKDGNRGKINWKRTIQKKEPVYNNGNLVYLDFVIKSNKINSNNLITRIHEYCVRESFEKLGWLYLSNETLPPKPNIKFNKKIFLAALNEAINSTFNDNKRLLFKSMINIVDNKEENVDTMETTAFGVNRFEYIWEKLVDYIFGEDNKEKYFPHATWHIINGGLMESSALEPDTIMLLDDKIYILDAKYYKYGITEIPKHLPGTSSIQKQITYGEYIDKSPDFSFDTNNIYNAFIMPYDKTFMGDEENYKFVSVGTADWKKYDLSTPNYHYVIGILLDTRFVIESYSKHNLQEIETLSKIIKESLDNNKDSIIKRIAENI